MKIREGIKAVTLETKYDSVRSSQQHQQQREEERESEDLEAVCRLMTAQIRQALTSSAH